MTDSNGSTGGKIHQAIINIMREVGPIAKLQENTQQRYRFRGVDDVYNACHPFMAEHGVYSTSTILDAKHEVSKSAKGQLIHHAILRMEFRYWAVDGSNVATQVIGEGIDYGGDKASNKAMSVADKYALLQLLKIPTAVADPDRDLPPAEPEAVEYTPTPARDERKKLEVVTKQGVMSLINKWKESHPEQAEDYQAWVSYVELATGTSFGGKKAPSGWTMDDFDRVAACLAVNEEIRNG